MTHPSYVRETLQAEYNHAVKQTANPKWSKATRESFLRNARELAEELGIDGPPSVNGRPAEPRQPTADEVIARIEGILAIGDGGRGQDPTALKAAKLSDVQNLLGRYRRGEL